MSYIIMSCLLTDIISTRKDGKRKQKIYDRNAIEQHGNFHVVN